MGGGVGGSNLWLVMEGVPVMGWRVEMGKEGRGSVDGGEGDVSEGSWEGFYLAGLTTA